VTYFVVVLLSRALQINYFQEPLSPGLLCSR